MPARTPPAGLGYFSGFAWCTARRILMAVRVVGVQATCGRRSSGASSSVHKAAHFVKRPLPRLGALIRPHAPTAPLARTALACSCQLLSCSGRLALTPLLHASRAGSSTWLAREKEPLACLQTCRCVIYKHAVRVRRGSLAGATALSSTSAHPASQARLRPHAHAHASTPCVDSWL